MITDADVKKLKGTFATKEDLAKVRLELGEVKGDLAEVKGDAKHIRVTLDKVAGAINELHTENGAGAVHLVRHDRQIEALATRANISLPD